MNLTLCKTCGKEVSVNAVMCPHCGEDLAGIHIKCPRCKAINIVSNKKGFSVGSALVGLFTLGLAGGLLGTSGKDDIVLYCQTCGYRWEPGKKSNRVSSGMIVFSIMLIGIGILLIKECWYISLFLLLLGIGCFIMGLGLNPVIHDIKK